MNLDLLQVMAGVVMAAWFYREMWAWFRETRKRRKQ